MNANGVLKSANYLKGRAVVVKCWEFEVAQGRPLTKEWIEQLNACQVLEMLTHHLVLCKMGLQERDFVELYYELLLPAGNDTTEEATQENWNNMALEEKVVLVYGLMSIMRQNGITFGALEALKALVSVS